MEDLKMIEKNQTILARQEAAIQAMKRDACKRADANSKQYLVLYKRLVDGKGARYA